MAVNMISVVKRLELLVSDDLAAVFAGGLGHGHFEEPFFCEVYYGTLVTELFEGFRVVFNLNFSNFFLFDINKL